MHNLQFSEPWLLHPLSCLVTEELASIWHPIKAFRLLRDSVVPLLFYWFDTCDKMRCELHSCHSDVIKSEDSCSESILILICCATNQRRTWLWWLAPMIPWTRPPRRIPTPSLPACRCWRSGSPSRWDIWCMRVWNRVCPGARKR